MKKKLIAIIALVILVTTALLIPTETYKKWFGKVPIEQEEKLYHQVIYLKNKDGYLVGLKVPVVAIEEDQIQQKWELLTKKVSLIPTGYKSTISPSTELIEHRIEEGKLILNVSNDFLESEGRSAIEALAWTFINDEITEVVILVNGETVKKLGDYHFKKIVKQTGINYKYETLFLYESTPTTLIHHYKDYTIPVTYFHLETSVCDFIIARTIFHGEEPLTTEVYNYVLTEESLVINLPEATGLDNLVIATIADSIKANFNVNSLTINGKEQIIHEVVFNPIEP